MDCGTPVRVFSPAARMSSQSSVSRPCFLPGSTDGRRAFALSSGFSPRLSGREDGFIFPVRDFSPAARTSDRFVTPVRGFSPVSRMGSHSSVSRPCFLPGFPDEKAVLYFPSVISPRQPGRVIGFVTPVRDFSPVSRMAVIRYHCFISSPSASRE